MKKLLRKVPSLDAVEEKYRDLYEQKDDSFVLVGVERIVEDEDIIKNLRTENAQTRVKNRELTETVAKFSGLDPDQTRAALLELESAKAELQVNGNKSREVIDRAVEARLKQATGPLEEKIKTLTTEKETLLAENTKHKKTNETRSIHDEARAAALKMKCSESSYTSGSDGDLPDILAWAERSAVIGADGKITHKTTGLTLEQSLRQIQDQGTRTHWWGTSSGGGAQGAGNTVTSGVNPWMPGAGWNISAQGKIEAEDPKRAEALATAAGTKLGAPYHPKDGMPKLPFMT